MYQQIKQRIFEILEVASEGDNISRYFDIFIISLIILNVFAVILESVEILSISYSTIFYWFEIFSVAIFSIEYISRIWVCTSNPSFKEPILGRVKFALTPFALIDLFAILPFFAPMFIPFDLRFIRSLRLLRIFRMLKMVRYSSSIQMLGNVLKKEKTVITIIFFVLLLILIFASSIMYFIEKDVQPDSFTSIPAAMWWAVVTLTTVGYGDIYPTTSLGKLIGTIIALVGIGMFALPAGVLASGFMEEIQKQKSDETDSAERSILLLEKLRDLKDDEVLTQEEFDTIKKRIISK